MGLTRDRQLVQFLLVPDRAAARRLRRVLAERRALQGVVVGTWIELLALAEAAYLLAAPDEDNWPKVLRERLASQGNAFWSGSLSVAPEETSAAIDQALAKLWVALGPERTISALLDTGDDPRLSRHLADLSRLEESLADERPILLSRIQRLLETPSDESIRYISVSHIEGFPRLDPWQDRLLKKLAGHCETPFEPQLRELHEEALVRKPQGISGSTLAHVQASLFEEDAERASNNASIVGLTVRDHLAEAEVVAGMIQKAVDQPKTAYSDFALLVRNSSHYLDAVSRVFERAGIPLSGLPYERLSRDLAYEALDHFLMNFEGPVPVMALAALVTSALMPWSTEDGHRLADRLMNGDFSLKPLTSFTADEGAMLELIGNPGDRNEDLREILVGFIDRFDDSDANAEHVERARQWLTETVEATGEATDLDATVLRQSLRAINIQNTPEFDVTQEGVAVFLEGEEPWRDVKQLFIIGFEHGNFPSLPGVSPVFFDEDLEALKEANAISILTNANLVAERRARLKRQICSVRERLVFSIPKFDALGAELTPSESLAFIRNLLSTESANALIVDMESSEGLDALEGISLAPSAKASSRELHFGRVLTLGQNLLSIRKTIDGEPRPESPSSLETLVVSPLAWLLQRLYAEPTPWLPENFGPLIKGNLAHTVFEGMFHPESPLPTLGEIPALVDQHFDEAMRRHMPLLRTAEWHVERQSLRRTLITAASQWREALVKLDARILGNEVWLHGDLNGMPIHGGADAIIQVSNDRLYVVDYKTSSSGPRRQRMGKGYDSQASLYRLMLQTGGLPDADDSVKKALERSREIGVLYFMLNDQIGLTDTDGWTDGTIPNIVELATDVSFEVLPLIEDRLGELAEGTIRLNTEADEKWFDRVAKITPYALDVSPLVRLFMCPLEPEIGERQ